MKHITIEGDSDSAGTVGGAGSAKTDPMKLDLKKRRRMSSPQDFVLSSDLKLKIVDQGHTADSDMKDSVLSSPPFQERFTDVLKNHKLFD